MAKPPVAPTAAARVRKKVKKNVAEGIAHIHASFNNTIVTITDRQGNTLAWATSGAAGFKGRGNRLRSPPKLTAEQAGRAAQECGVKESRGAHQGPGPGRESAVRALNALGLKISSIADVTPVPTTAAGRRKSGAYRGIRMARDLDAKCRQCRREGRSSSSRARNAYRQMRDRAPQLCAGQHGQKSGGRMSDFGKQLRRSRSCVAYTGCSSASSARPMQRLRAAKA